jgi:putative lipoprotein
MKPRVLVLSALTLLFTTQARAEDRWWARDKALHFSVSSALAAGGYGVGSLLLERRWQRASFGAGVALTAGVGKELYDEATYGGASYKDLVFDVAGTLVGVTAAWLIDYALHGKEPDSPGEGQARLQLRF